MREGSGSTFTLDDCIREKVSYLHLRVRVEARVRVRTRAIVTLAPTTDAL